MSISEAQLRESLRELVEALDDTYWSSWQTTAKFDKQLAQARELLEELK